MSTRRYSDKQKVQKVAWGAALIMLGALGVQAAGEGLAAEGLAAEGWQFPGDRREGPITITTSPDGHAVTVEFRRSNFPAIQAVDVVAGSAGNGKFTGDFNGRGIEGCTFTIACEGDTPQTRVLYFRSGAGNEFRHLYDVSGEPGDVVPNDISLINMEGWRSDVPLTEENWLAALGDVAEIGVRIQAPQVTAGGQVTVADFKLYGTGFVTDPADLRPVIKRVAVSESGLRMRWTGEKGRHYTVLRCDSLTGEFVPVDAPGAQNVLAEEDGIVEVEVPVEPGEGRLFYKIRKD